MNCERFNELIVDLARGGGLEEAVRVEASAHVELCQTCLDRLRAQQALSELFALAAADRIEAPACVETSLLSAYRLSRQMQGEAPSPRREKSRHHGPLSIAAAVFLALLGAVSYRVLQLPQPIRVAEPLSGTESPGKSRSARIVAATPPDVPKGKPAPVAARLAPAAPKPTPRPPQPRTQPVENEIATDFFPLVSRNEIAAMESGQIVRVLLPRNAMAVYGLPVNQERMDEPVAAQVLIGQDGVARAIRFLGAQNANFVPAGMRTKR